jgi:uncharacterized membrane protein
MKEKNRVTRPLKSTVEDVIEANFNKLEDKIDILFGEIQEELISIRIQTTKTNGTVVNHEERIQKVCSEINKLSQKAESCPIRKVEEETEIVRFLARNPKFFKFVVVLVLSSIVISGVKGLINIL